jgi:hypothetical protein
VLSVDIIGPIFFSQTITVERYPKLILNFISLLEVDKHDCWFQQDGAAVHTANSTMQMLREFFGGHIISQHLLPPRSPDLLPLDFFGGFEGERVQKQPTHIRRIETKY